MLPLSRPLSRRSWLLLALILALVASLQIVSRADATTAVTGGISQAYHPGTVSSPSTDAPYDGEPLTVQTSYVGRGAAEPTLGIDKQGNAFFAAGQFDSLARALPKTFVMKSTDGGVTWSKTSPVIPGTNEPNPPVTADPMVVVDQDTGRVFNPELYAACNWMGISDDQGQSWITNPAACGNLTVDHQTVAVAPFPPALAALKTTYPNVVYYCANRVIDANCGHSFDGGITWSPTPTPAFLGYDPELDDLCGGLHGHLDSDSQGRLFLPKGHCGNPWVAISDNAGTTWKRVQVSNIGAFDSHLAVATDAADNVYMLWSGRDKLPYLSISTDHGATWSDPLMVAPPGVKEVEFPVLEAGDAGKIAINFIGNTTGLPPGCTHSALGSTCPDNHRPWNQYMAISTDVLSDNPTFVSTTANPASDPVIRGYCSETTTSAGSRCGGIWDFLDIQTSPQDGAVWMAGADGCQRLSCTRAGGKRDGSVMTGEGFAVRQLTGPWIRTIAAPTP